MIFIGLRLIFCIVVLVFLSQAASAAERKEPVVTLGEPSLVAQGPVDEHRWGRWQFPSIERLADGRIHVSWHVAEDAASAYGTVGASAVSADNGKSWALLSPEEAEKVEGGIALQNGERLKLLGEKSIPTKFLQLPERIGGATDTYGSAQYAFYQPSELPESLVRRWPQKRLAPGTTTWIREYPKVEIPGELVYTIGEVLVLPFFMGLLVPAPDGSLWTSCYWRRLVDGEVSTCLPTFVRSTDGGRTWEFVSDIPYQPDPEADEKWDKRNGFTEPEIAFMPDGSMLAILRTTDGHGNGPLYIARSTDDGKTWGKPQAFDSLGVLPQLLVLKNGTTIASYGRPNLHVRATSDPSGLTWPPRMDVPVHKAPWGATCGYTRLLALDEETAMLVYSDFGYPDSDGNPRKTIFVRTITVTP